MYEDFHVTDHWTKEDLHCRWTANMVAIATRHADAIDVRFDVNGKAVWIALPAEAWVDTGAGFRATAFHWPRIVCRDRASGLLREVDRGTSPRDQMFAQIEVVFGGPRR